MVFIPFSGKGFLVPLITFGSLVATEWLVEAQFHDNHYYQTHGWPKGLAFALAAFAVAALSHSLSQRQTSTLLDPATGREVVVTSQNHSFLFLPLQFWSLILLLLGVVFSFVTTGGA